VQGQHAETAKLVLPSYDNASSTAAQSAASKIHVWLPRNVVAFLAMLIQRLGRSRLASFHAEYVNEAAATREWQPPQPRTGMRDWVVPLFTDPLRPPGNSESNGPEC